MLVLPAWRSRGPIEGLVLRGSGRICNDMLLPAPWLLGAAWLAAEAVFAFVYAAKARRLSARCGGPRDYDPASAGVIDEFVDQLRWLVDAYGQEKAAGLFLTPW